MRRLQLICVLDRRCSMEKERRGIAAMMSGCCTSSRSRAVLAHGVEFLRGDTHRGWDIASMARGAARRARFS
jgi:hypothetical protein